MLNKKPINQPHRQLEDGPEQWQPKAEALADIDVPTKREPLWTLGTKGNPGKVVIVIVGLLIPVAGGNILGGHRQNEPSFSHMKGQKSLPVSCHSIALLWSPPFPMLVVILSQFCHRSLSLLSSLILPYIDGPLSFFLSFIHFATFSTWLSNISGLLSSTGSSPHLICLS